VNVSAPAFRMEVVSRFTSLAVVETTLYTDDQGLEVHARPLRGDEQLSANYHACVAACQLVSQLGQVTVLVPYTMGIASLDDGQMELMIHRRMNTSDSQG
jgi:alpha-mannosidase